MQICMIRKALAFCLPSSRQPEPEAWLCRIVEMQLLSGITCSATLWRRLDLMYCSMCSNSVINVVRSGVHGAGT
jgi:hypothetical protein